MNRLPDEVLLEVLSWLPTKDLLLVVPHVCQRWLRLSEDPRLWRQQVAKFSASDEGIVINERLGTLLSAAGRPLELRFSPAEQFSAELSARSRRLEVMHMPSHLPFAASMVLRTLAAGGGRPCPVRSLTLDRGPENGSDQQQFEKCRSTRFRPPRPDPMAHQLLSCLRVGIFRNLTSLTIYDGLCVSDELLDAICVGCPQLNSLAVQRSALLTDTGLSRLAILYDLRALDLTFAQLRSTEFLRPLEVLQELSLSLCVVALPDFAENLTYLQRLERLRLAMCRRCERSLLDLTLNLQFTGSLCFDRRPSHHTWGTPETPAVRHAIQLL